MARGRKANEGRVILLSNSLSTHNRKCLPEIFKVAERYSFVEHLEGNSLKRLYIQLRAFKGEEIDLLILNGGDGTIHSALTFLMNNRIFKDFPKIAILGGGMTNMIARDLKTGGPVARDLETILESYARGEIDTHISEHNLVRIDFNDKREPQFGMFFGGASMPSLISYTVNHIYPLGIKGKMAQLIGLGGFMSSFLFGRYRKGWIGYAPEMDVVFDNGKTYSGHISLVATTTLSALIFGGHAPYKAGHLPLLILRPHVRAVIIALFRGAMGTIDRARTKTISFDHVKSVTIRGGASFVLDGEIHQYEGTGPIKVSGTEPLKFVSFRGK